MVLDLKREPVLAILKKRNFHCYSGYPFRTTEDGNMRLLKGDVFGTKYKRKKQKDNNNKICCSQKLPDLNHNVKIRKCESRTTDNDLQCGNKSSHHQNKTIFKDNRDENFEGHSRQDTVR